MDGSFEEAWRTGTILILALLGAAAAGRGVGQFFRGVGSQSPDAGTLLAALRGFRLAVIGLALIGGAAAWLWGEIWLLVLSLGIAGEETFETSMMIWALKKDSGLRSRDSLRTHDSAVADAFA